jgi:hypothetical protein
MYLYRTKSVGRVSEYSSMHIKEEINTRIYSYSSGFSSIDHILQSLVFCPTLLHSIGQVMQVWSVSVGIGNTIG